MAADSAPPPTANLDALLCEFIEEYPLYREVVVRLGKPAFEVSMPASIARFCGAEKCSSQITTTWKLGDVEKSAAGRVIEYECAHCKSMSVHVWVQQRGSSPVFGETPSKPFLGYWVLTLCKIGQWPTWSIDIPVGVQKSMGVVPGALDLYKNGLVCMSQSYGIGALSYFRRIIEDTVDLLLNVVEEAATFENDGAALQAVEAARRSKVAGEKLRLIAQAVPATLRPGGVNPLSTIYNDYSLGLHALSDEECLAIAMDLKDSLEFFFGNLLDLA